MDRIYFCGMRFEDLSRYLLGVVVIGAITSFEEWDFTRAHQSRIRDNFEILYSSIRNDL